MLRNGLLLLTLVVFAAGCAGVKAQGYVMTTNRVDIKDKAGNAGYISGKGQYQEPERKTRKVYVLELTKSTPEGEIKKIEQETAVTQEDQVAAVPMLQESESVAEDVSEQRQERKIILPRFDDEEVVADVKPHVAMTGPSETQAYTVQKDDTLQKIAKKFYGSYGKWTKLYDANKDKLKNPNFVRPGTVLTIPSAEEMK